MSPARAGDRLAAAGDLLARHTADGAAVRRALDRALGVARAWVALRGTRRGRRVYVGGRLRVVNAGEITIGDRVCFFGGMLASELRCHAGAKLAIGSDCLFNYGVSLEAGRLVQLGQRCLVGSLVRIADTGRTGAAPVVIGDDVWLAHGAIIEPGVTIGDGSVVSAGSVVATDIPPGSLAIGNPARAVRLSVASPSAEPGGVQA